LPVNVKAGPSCISSEASASQVARQYIDKFTYRRLVQKFSAGHFIQGISVPEVPAPVHQPAHIPQDGLRIHAHNLADRRIQRLGLGIEHRRILQCKTHTQNDPEKALLRAAAARAANYTFEMAGAYPGYAGDPDSPLAQIFDKVHQDQLGTPMKFKSVHAGLELGILGAKNPDLTVVAIGPDGTGAHSIFEQAPINKFPTFVRLLAGVLEELAAE